MLTTGARRAAVTIMVVMPLLAELGLLYGRAHADAYLWDWRVLLATLVAAVVLVPLVALAGASPRTPSHRWPGVAAAALVALGVVSTGAVFVWFGQGCSTRTLHKELLLVGVVPVVVGAVVWPWIVREAPGRRSRWLLGPAAGVYLIATTYALLVMRDLLFDYYGGCGE